MTRREKERFLSTHRDENVAMEWITANKLRRQTGECSLKIQPTINLRCTLAPDHDGPCGHQLSWEA